MISTKIGRLKTIKFLFAISAVYLLFLFSAKTVLAGVDNRFVTIVNPVRISAYNKNPKESLSAEYSVVRQNGLPATWLLTFDAMTNPAIISVVKRMNKKQEFGIFLEVTPDFAKEADVSYHNTGFWHHASSVFLSGYTQGERKLLIDKVFEKFKKVFGYYPASVGSWWTDSFSLGYMQEKYGVTANLGCSDQFSADGYQIWGQPWSTPFYPSKYHAGIPASDDSVKLDLVTIQWAPRDPLNGYKNSAYSTQDYSTLGNGLNTDYFEKLLGLYAKAGKNEFGQLTVGLEGDLDSKVYSGEFTRQLSLVKKLKDSGEITAVNMKDFSAWYRKRFPSISPSQIYETKDFLGSGLSVLWYQSAYYRVGMVYNPDEKKTKIIDLRVYNENAEEPYYFSPNTDFNLYINIPSVIDGADNTENVWEISASPEDFSFSRAGFSIDKAVSQIPEFVRRSKLVSVTTTAEGVEVKIGRSWFTPPDGTILYDFTPEAVHFFHQKKAILSLLMGKGWDYFVRVPYLVPPGEMEALEKLSQETPGKVLVFDNECLQCEWHTKYKPPAFADRRNYVGIYSGHPIIYNKDVFQAKTREDAKKNLVRSRVKYIYLVKFEGYVEKLPFSPGDLGVEKIFENANAVIWKVKQMI